MTAQIIQDGLARLHPEASWSVRVDSRVIQVEARIGGQRFALTHEIEGWWTDDLMVMHFSRAFLAREGPELSAWEHAAHAGVDAALAALAQHGVDVSRPTMASDLSEMELRRTAPDGLSPDEVGATLMGALIQAFAPVDAVTGARDIPLRAWARILRHRMEGDTWVWTLLLYRA